MSGRFSVASEFLKEEDIEQDSQLGKLLSNIKKYDFNL